MVSQHDYMKFFFFVLINSREIQVQQNETVLENYITVLKTVVLGIAALLSYILLTPVMLHLSCVCLGVAVWKSCVCLWQLSLRSQKEKHRCKLWNVMTAEFHLASSVSQSWQCAMCMLLASRFCKKQTNKKLIFIQCWRCLSGRPSPWF